MKIGDTFEVSLVELVKPLTGRLVTVTLPGEEKDIKARIVSVDEMAPSSAILKVVSEGTKD